MASPVPSAFLVGRVVLEPGGVGEIVVRSIRRGRVVGFMPDPSYAPIQVLDVRVGNVVSNLTDVRHAEHAGGSRGVPSRVADQWLGRGGLPPVAVGEDVAVHVENEGDRILDLVVTFPFEPAP